MNTCFLRCRSKLLLRWNFYFLVVWVKNAARDACREEASCHFFLFNEIYIEKNTHDWPSLVLDNLFQDKEETSGQMWSLLSCKERQLEWRVKTANSCKWSVTSSEKETSLQRNVQLENEGKLQMHPVLRKYPQDILVLCILLFAIEKEGCLLPHKYWTLLWDIPMRGWN